MTKTFKTIDNGCRCRKDFIGYGWHIEGNTLCKPWENYVIAVPKKIYDSVSWGDDVISKNMYGKKHYLCFSNQKDAKAWCVANAKYSECYMKGVVYEGLHCQSASQI